MRVQEKTDPIHHKQKMKKKEITYDKRYTLGGVFHSREKAEGWTNELPSLIRPTSSPGGPPPPPHSSHLPSFIFLFHGEGDRSLVTFAPTVLVEA